ncbi:MAG: hypothetical protein DMG12_23595 [Acidobacteria bacterium]|nr:MAG: hypothetical protein DMG12_23595 [Acidobacteriota bacterium]
MAIQKDRDAIVIGKVVVTPQFRCENAVGLSVQTSDSEKNTSLRVEDSDLGLLRRRLAFTRILLNQGLISRRFN